MIILREIKTDEENHHNAYVNLIEGNADIITPMMEAPSKFYPSDMGDLVVTPDNRKSLLFD